MLQTIRPILDRPFFYELYNKVIGADYRSRVLLTDYVRLQPGDCILDIGCGPGNLVPFLPDCKYLGVDANPAYISSARRRYSHRGQFICERVSHHNVQELGTFDVVLALGLVHHLDDNEANDLFRLGHAALRPGGRMITMDGCYRPGQSRTERYLLSRDRGRFVRPVDEYVRLAAGWFENVQTHLRVDVLRIPYTHLFLECVR